MEAMIERVLDPIYAYQYTMGCSRSWLFCHVGVVLRNSSRGIC